VQPIRAVKEILPVSMNKIAINTSARCVGHPFHWCTSTTTSWVFDFGQEFAGIVRLQ
jgi:hypothetical protein